MRTYELFFRGFTGFLCNNDRDRNVVYLCDNYVSPLKFTALAFVLLCFLCDVLKYSVQCFVAFSRLAVGASKLTADAMVSMFEGGLYVYRVFLDARAAAARAAAV